MQLLTTMQRILNTTSSTLCVRRLKSHQAHSLCLKSLSNIEDQVKFVAENAIQFMQLLTWFESRQVLIHKAFNKLIDLIQDMASQQLSDWQTENSCRQEVFQ